MGRSLPRRSRTSRVRSHRHRPWAIASLAVALLAAGLVAATTAEAAPVAANIAVANNAYGFFTDPTISSSTGVLVHTFNIAQPTFSTAGQSGGYWNATTSGGAADTTTLRGITSGNLRQQLTGPPPYSPTCTLCASGPLTNISAFFSADESNVKALIPVANGGTCPTTAAQCPGVASSKTLEFTGHLAIYSCDVTNRGNGTSPGTAGHPAGDNGTGSGNGTPASPRCDGAPLQSAFTTVAQIVTWLRQTPGTDPGDPFPSHVVSIALPTSAPFGAAAQAALLQGGLTSSEYTSWAKSAAACDSANAATPDSCRIRLESGISQVRGAVTSGSAPVGIPAVSNLKHITFTSGTQSGTTADDPNVWTQISDAQFSTYGAIKEYGVALTTNATVVNMVKKFGSTPAVVALKTKYGYT